MTNVPRLTLVAQFDDQTRNGRILTQGIESDFEKFVRFQEEWRKRLMNSHEEKQELIDRMKHLETVNVSLETKLKHARSQIDHELKKRRMAEADRQSLDYQMNVVRELLNGNTRLDEKDRQKLELINSDYQVSHQYYSPRQNLSMIEESCSLLSDADISYDKTEEDIDCSYLRSGKPWKRPHPSAPHMEEDMTNIENTSPDKKKRRSRRRHRRSRSANAVVTARVSVDADGVDATAEIEADNGRRKRVQSGSPNDRRTMRKYNSADPVTPGSSDEMSSRNYNNASPRTIMRELNRQVTPPSGTLRRHNSGNNLNRPHTFLPRTILRPGGETCIPCGKRIAFGNKAVKCKGCNVITHPECKEEAPLPCISCNFTPNRNVKNLLSDYAPVDPPCIPAIVIHCINEVDERGLTEQGIYRVPGSEKEVRELKEKFFKGKGIPCLTNVNDINVICGCLKSFLKDLKEPLVTYEQWNSFVTGARNPDQDEAYSAVYQAVSELPRANRDTLAFVILHLQKVSESPLTKMDANNLAKVFGPTLVGYSSNDISAEQMFKETNYSQKVVAILMSLSPDYWSNFIKDSDVSLYPNTTNLENSPYTPRDRDRHYELTTPDTLKRPAVYESMLGPITTPTSYNESKKGWMNTPKSVKRDANMTTGRRNYFASPVF